MLWCVEVNLRLELLNTNYQLGGRKFELELRDHSSSTRTVGRFGNTKHNQQFTLRCTHYTESQSLAMG